MKRVLLLAVAIGIAGTWVGTTPAFGGQRGELYPVCHQTARLDDDGVAQHRLIWVSEAGKRNHLEGSHAEVDYVPIDPEAMDVCNGEDRELEAFDN